MLCILSTTFTWHVCRSDLLGDRLHPLLGLVLVPSPETLAHPDPESDFELDAVLAVPNARHGVGQAQAALQLVFLLLDGLVELEVWSVGSKESDSDMLVGVMMNLPLNREVPLLPPCEILRPETTLEFEVT